MRLSPGRLLELLSAAPALDAELIAGWRLRDCYVLRAEGPLRVEVEGPDGVVEVRVYRDERARRAYRKTSGLAIVHPADRPEVGRRLSDRVADALDRSAARFAGVAEAVAPAIRAEVSERPAEIPHPDLARDASHYALAYGPRPRATQVTVRGVDVPGRSVHYPAPTRRDLAPVAAVYPFDARLARRRIMRRYFGSLGFVTDAEGYARTVPAPDTLRRALATLGVVSPLEARVVTGVGASLPGIHLARFLARGILPVTVAPGWLARLHARAPLVPCHVGMLQHDMSLHAAALHRVSRDQWGRLVRAARSRARARPACLLWALPSFFESTLTSAGWESWKAIDAPSEFERSFEARMPALLEALRRL